MSWIWYAVGTGWLLLAIGVAYVIAKSIKLADRMERHLEHF